MRKRTAGLVLAAALAAAAAVAILSVSLGGSQYSSEVSKATNYLAANYNPRIGLISETPKGNTYFVYSDNFLASYVLGRSGNSTLRAIASNITSTDDRYLAKLHNPANQYEAIDSSGGSFFASGNYVLAHVGGATIEVTLNNGTTALSPVSYADIAFLDALDLHWTGNSGASDFDQGVKDYDGVGFKDAAFTGQYQTYELALCAYAGKALGIAAPAGLEANLLKMQAPSGGFYTGYSADFSTAGTSTNTETTSLAILALSTSTSATGSSSSSPLPYLLAAVAAAVPPGLLVARRLPKAGARHHRTRNPDRDSISHM